MTATGFEIDALVRFIRKDPREKATASPHCSDYVSVLGFDLKIGRGEKIRTSDPFSPREVRYQAALRPDRFQVFAAKGPLLQAAIILAAVGLGKIRI